MSLFNHFFGQKTPTSADIHVEIAGQERAKAAAEVDIAKAKTDEAAALAAFDPNALGRARKAIEAAKLRIEVIDHAIEGLREAAAKRIDLEEREMLRAEVEEHNRLAGLLNGRIATDYAMAATTISGLIKDQDTQKRRQNALRERAKALGEAVTFVDPEECRRSQVRWKFSWLSPIAVVENHGRLQEHGDPAPLSRFTIAGSFEEAPRGTFRKVGDGFEAVAEGARCWREGGERATPLRYSVGELPGFAAGERAFWRPERR